MDASVIDRLAQASVLVVGDVMLDRFIEGRVTRISREAPVPVLKFGASRAHLGGAGNVTANLLAYGGAVTLAALTGADAAAVELAALCAAFHRLTPRLIADPGRQTTVKTRYLSAWQQLFCVDAEDSHAPAADVREKVIAAAQEAIGGVGMLVLSDYGRGALDTATITALIALARKAGKQVVVDPRHADATVFAGATLVTPNLEEMHQFTGIRADSDEAAAAACQSVLDQVEIGRANV